MRRRTMVVTLTVVGIAVGGVVAGTFATTLAQFSDTASSTQSRVGTATVELGEGDGTVKLGYTNLLPGHRQVLDLIVSYQGNVPADITLEIGPAGSSEFCVQQDGRWQSRRGGAVTVVIGSAAPVNYCELLNGRVLPLASALPPGSERHIDVAVMLSEDAGPAMRGLAEQGVVTIRAGGGFTDHTVGTMSITTADPDPVAVIESTGNDAAGQLSPAIAPPSRTVGTSSTGQPVTLPAECEQAGMRLDDFEDMIVLDAGQRTWSALEQRGQGAGPFLVVSSGDDDEIAGSEGADCIVGGGGRTHAVGGAGGDVLIGGLGADLLDGGPGDDRLFGGPGADDLRGGDGTDLFDGGADGALCDAGPDTAGTVGCQPPAAPTLPPAAPETSAPPANSATPAPVTTSEPPVPVTTSEPPVPVITSETPVPVTTSESPAPVTTSETSSPPATTAHPDPESG